MIQSLLQEACIPLAECDAIGFGAGPGSFTGVRTACGIAQGLAFGANLPLIPIVTLAAMAQACLSTHTQHQQLDNKQETIDIIDVIDVLAILDARMNEVYWAQYRYINNNDNDNNWQTIIEPTLSTATALMPYLSRNHLEKPNKIIACGNGLMAYASVFDESTINKQAHIMPHAKEIGSLARQAFLRGEIMAAHEAQPFYLRNKIALTTAERERKGQTPT